MGNEENNLNNNSNKSENLMKQKRKKENSLNEKTKEIRSGKNNSNMSIRFNKDVMRDSKKNEQEYLAMKKEEQKILEDEMKKNIEINSVQESKTKELNAEKKNEKPQELKNIAHITENELTNQTSNTNRIEEINNIVTTKNTTVDEKETKEKRPSRIELKGKSEQFKKIIDLALAFESIEEDRKKLKDKNINLSNEIKNLKEEKKKLKENLGSTELLCQKKQKEIERLNSEVDHRNEVIDIVKADKNESAQEFKNALGVSLKSYMQDYEELKTMDMSDDVGYAIIDTLEGVFKTLEKNGIHIE